MVKSFQGECMVYIGVCGACQMGLHSSCEGHRRAPEGYFGGSMCNCKCRETPMPDNPEIGRKRFESLFKKNEPISLDEIKVLAEKAAKWAESEEGREKLQAAMREAKKAIEWLEKERKLTWEQLNTPMSI